MMKKIRKIKLMAETALVITLAVPQAQAFPLPCSDPSRLVASMRVTMQDIMTIKQEVESNMQIVQMIANGGFAQAGAAIFGKIQNGDYDRFGNALGNVKNNTQDMANNVKEGNAQKKREKELRAQGMSEELAKEQAKQESAERMQAYQAAKEQKALEAKKKRGSNAFSSAYNWLKDNQSFTSGARNTLSGVANGNWGQAISGAATATGGAINSGGKNSTLGNIFEDSAAGAGSTLNSALNGNWGSAFNSAVSTTGATVGEATGSRGTGNAISSIGDIGEGFYNVMNSDGNFGEKTRDLINSGQIQSGISGAARGYNQRQAEQDAAKKAADEAANKAAEKLRQNSDNANSQMQQYRQEQCQRCKDNNKAAGRDEMSGCLTACTSN